MLEVLRKEIKYIIPIEKFLAMKQKLEVMMKMDSHGKGGKYMVRTQYFDSLSDQDFFDNLQGIMEKRKIRIRIYSFDSELAKLEYKCKSGIEGRKMSLTISKAEAIEMENGKFESLLKKNEDLAKFLYVKATQNAYRPKTIVQYNRMAFSYPASDLRITFDTSIRGTVNPYGLFNENVLGSPVLTEDLGVLEIKYNYFIPSPFKDIIGEVDNVAEGISKYSISRLLI